MEGRRMDEESRDSLAKALEHLDGAAKMLGGFLHRIAEDTRLPQEVYDSHAGRVHEALLSITGGMTAVGKMLLVDAGAKMAASEVDVLFARVKGAPAGQSEETEGTP